MAMQENFGRLTLYLFKYYFLYYSEGHTTLLKNILRFAIFFYTFFNGVYFKK